VCVIVYENQCSVAEDTLRYEGERLGAEAGSRREFLVSFTFPVVTQKRCMLETLHISLSDSILSKGFMGKKQKKTKILEI